MRTRITFLAGFAAGFVAGARAGRERYEQMVKLGRKVAEYPAVRQATRTAGTKAAELSKTASAVRELRIQLARASSWNASASRWLGVDESGNG